MLGGALFKGDLFFDAPAWRAVPTRAVARRRTPPDVRGAELQPVLHEESSRGARGGHTAMHTAMHTHRQLPQESRFIEKNRKDAWPLVTKSHKNYFKINFELVRRRSESDRSSPRPQIPLPTHCEGCRTRRRRRSFASSSGCPRTACARIAVRSDLPLRARSLALSPRNHSRTPPRVTTPTPPPRAQSASRSSGSARWSSRTKASCATRARARTSRSRTARRASACRTGR